MKKELLIASALVGSVGLAGVAEAASASMSGHQKVGVVGSEIDTATNGATNSASRQSTFSVSLSETTDGGIGISTGFDLAEESTSAATVDQSGLTLTFTSGAKLDLIEAGNSATTHVASIPSGAGEMAVAGDTDTNAPTTITFADAGDTVGFEFHTAADAFGVDGLKASVSFSTNTDAANTTGTHTDAGMMSVGASYVTTTGDSTVTLGFGTYAGSTTNTESKYEDEAYVVTASAVTGDLTVGVGFASGTNVGEAGTASVDGQTEGYAVTGAEVLKAGAKYVSGDMTFSVGVTAGTGNDNDIAADATGSDDSYDSANASIQYAVASGVTATLGYADISRSNDGTTDSAASGSSWYVGAAVSF
jgi:hypothetical protein